MNEVLRRRLIGLAVLLFGLFLLSWFVPGGDERGLPPETPSTVVPLAGGEPASPVPATTEPPTAEPAAEPAAEPPIADLTDDHAPPAESAKTAPSEPAPAPVAPPAAPAKPALKLAPSVALDHPAAAKKPVPAAALASKPEIAKTAPPAKPAPPATGGGWWIQIGSYSDRGKAETILSLLRGAGYFGGITPVQGHKGPLNRVRLGPYANEAAARAAQQRVAHQGYPQTQVVNDANDH